MRDGDDTGLGLLVLLLILAVVAIAGVRLVTDPCWGPAHSTTQAFVSCRQTSDDSWSRAWREGR